MRKDRNIKLLSSLEVLCNSLVDVLVEEEVKYMHQRLQVIYKKESGLFYNAPKEHLEFILKKPISEREFEVVFRNTTKKKQKDADELNRRPGPKTSATITTAKYFGVSASTIERIIQCKQSTDTLYPIPKKDLLFLLFSVSASKGFKLKCSSKVFNKVRRNSFIFKSVKRAFKTGKYSEYWLI